MLGFFFERHWMTKAVDSVDVQLVIFDKKKFTECNKKAPHPFFPLGQGFKHYGILCARSAFIWRPWSLAA